MFRGPVSNEVNLLISVSPSNLIFMLFLSTVEICVSKSNADVDALDHLPMLDEFVCTIAVDCIPEEYNGVSLTDYCADSLGPILLCQPVVRSAHGRDICSQFGCRCRCSWFSSHALLFCLYHRRAFCQQNIVQIALRDWSRAHIVMQSLCKISPQERHMIPSRKQMSMPSPRPTLGGEQIPNSPPQLIILPC